MDAFSLRRTLCFVALVCLAGRAQAEKTWTEVRSPHFRVITDGSGHDARGVANDLEQMRHVFVLRLNSEKVDGGAPLTIFAARDGQSFRELEPGVWKARGDNIAGEFHRGWEKQYATIRLDTWQGQGQVVVYHEYAHSILHATTHWMPVWLDEGLAEFYAYTRFRGDGIFVGAPSMRMGELRNRALLPVTEMLSPKEGAKFWKDDVKVQLFYAEAWAMVHYMFFGPGMDSGAKLNTFFQALQNKTDQDKAFRDAFGEPHAFEKGLQQYVSLLAFSAGKLPPDKGIDPKTFSERKLSPAETAYELGCFHVATHDLVAGRAFIEQALQLDPKLAAAHEELGYLEFDAGRDEPARNQWRQAFALDPQLFRSLFSLTMTGSSLTSRTSSQLLATQGELQQVTRLAAWYAPAYVELALVEWRLGILQQAYKDASQAETLEPWRAGYHLVTGHVLLRGNQPAAAAKYARYVADHWEGPDHDEAVDLWQAIPAAQRGEGPLLVRELPAGATVVEGQLATVTCSDAPGPKHFSVTLLPKDANAKPLSFSSDGRMAVGFSDSLWWGEDHFTTCHHLEGLPAILAYKHVPSGDAEMVELEVRDDLPPQAAATPATSAANAGTVAAPAQ